MTNLDLINDLMEFQADLRKLNDDFAGQERLYERATKMLEKDKFDYNEFRSNEARAIEGMKMLSVALKHSHDDSVALLAKVRVLADKKPLFVWFIHNFSDLHYGPNFEAKFREELDRVRSEMRESMARSQERIDRIKSELSV